MIVSSKAFSTCWVEIGKSIYTVELPLKLDCNLTQVIANVMADRTPRGYEDFITLFLKEHWIDDFMHSQRSKLHLDIYKQFIWRGKQSFDFQSTWLSYKGIIIKYAENSNSRLQPVVILQWLNLCGRTRLQSCRLKPTTISGLGSGLKTTVSNHKMQTNISIKQDHTVIRKVLNLVAKHLYPTEQDVNPQ